MSLTNLQFVPARWFNNDGLVLAGGFLWFYQRGTTTPAGGSVFRDPDGTNAWTNPVELDAGGHADIYLKPGAYTVVLKDFAGVQVLPPVDVIQGGAGFGGSDTETVNIGTALICKTYDDVRHLSGQYDAVYVAGRETEGDGGQGWFQLSPNDNGSDDGGVRLVAGSVRYLRILDDILDPLWWGVQYNASVHQGINVLAAHSASMEWHLPVRYVGRVFLAQDMALPAGSGFQMEVGSSFDASVPVSMIIPSGTLVDIRGRHVFARSVQPLFGAGLVPDIRLSWMGGVTVEDRIAKFEASYVSVTDVQRMCVDEEVTTTAGFSLSYPQVLCGDGGRITFSPVGAITIRATAVESGTFDVFRADDLLTSDIDVDFGDLAVDPLWFGTSGQSWQYNSSGIGAGIKHGNLMLHAGTYSVVGAITQALTKTTLRIAANEAGAELDLQGLAHAVTNLELRNVKLLNVLTSSITATEFLGIDVTMDAYAANAPTTATAQLPTYHTWLIANAATFEGGAIMDGIEVTTLAMSGTRILQHGDSNPTEAGKPQLYNAHLPLLPNQMSLATDEVGKIVPGVWQGKLTGTSFIYSGNNDAFGAYLRTNNWPNTNYYDYTHRWAVAMGMRPGLVAFNGDYFLSTTGHNNVYGTRADAIVFGRMDTMGNSQDPVECTDFSAAFSHLNSDNWDHSGDLTKTIYISAWLLALTWWKGAWWAASTNNCVWRSVNDGLTWTRVYGSSVFGGDDAPVMTALLPAGDYLLAANSQGSVYRTAGNVNSSGAYIWETVSSYYSFDADKIRIDPSDSNYILIVPWNGAKIYRVKYTGLIPAGGGAANTTEITITVTGQTPTKFYDIGFYPRLGQYVLAYSDNANWNHSRWEAWFPFWQDTGEAGPNGPSYDKWANAIEFAVADSLSTPTFKRWFERPTDCYCKPDAAPGMFRAANSYEFSDCNFYGIGNDLLFLINQPYGDSYNSRLSRLQAVALDEFWSAPSRDIWSADVNTSAMFYGGVFMRMNELYMLGIFRVAHEHAPRDTRIYLLEN